MKRTSKWISSITLRVKFCQVSADQVTRRVNFRMATPWPWTPRATSSSLRSASETRQATEFRNSGSWRAGRCRSRSPKFCPPVIPAAYTVAVHRQDAITPSHDRCHRIVSAFLRLIHTHRSPPSLPKRSYSLVDRAASLRVIRASTRTSIPSRQSAFYAPHSELQECRRVPTQWSHIDDLRECM